MEPGIDARQIEQVLSHLARLQHRRDHADADTLDELKPGWLDLDTWEVVLDDLETQRYQQHTRAPRLQLVR